MSEIDLVLVNESDNCTIYTLQFQSESETEFERFYNKFKDDAEYNPDLMRIVAFINKIAQNGAFERFFRPEGRIADHVVALPVLTSKLRLYCLRLSDKILILGNGGVKNSRTYNEDDTLRGYVITLQNFERLLKEGQQDGLVTITEKTIEIKVDGETKDADLQTTNITEI
ncbi:MAG: hypothetical protein MJZ33_13435 [Paludibacteraceae bacterium]|nr:hypothetical protein [Paludibacteraceae bacterium]